ncbi:hypothetical protein BU24DRAFT_452001 [Aaosphaeria arxii CBS 175.79]|uniref:Heterokaryon incompatibility domain-containing protein n=1 Tax=Aaosphaeria arxii CBS 175.79 TaxID=1450172 RepID=A0A6A5XPE6_9PLEO|nr:uncharacterized protein BU24DRAFT_452001 [Aaosphaeria arxii CBS 175.79]KAF2015118.1 hypothetical protein BU24DRAFT_452001 [Aaosphaeria arxii CBS 175.79]
MEKNLKALYRTLPIPRQSKCLRFLEVKPATSELNGGPIRCSMLVADLDERPSFAALSYVWGAPNPIIDHVYCNDVAVLVTANCYSALWHLRKSMGSFVIWIDALCINQMDDDEKAHQIGLMGDVYSRAEKVFIWLGEGDESTERAMEFLSKTGLMQLFFKNGNPDEGEIPKLRAIPAAWWWLARNSWTWKTQLSPLDSNILHWPWNLGWLARFYSTYARGFATLDDLNGLLDRDWANRIWTFQEIILANNPVVVCGNSFIAWERLAYAIMFPLDAKKTSTLFQTWGQIVISRDMYRSVAILDSKRPALCEPARAQMMTRYRKFLRLTAFLYSTITICIELVVSYTLANIFWMIVLWIKRSVLGDTTNSHALRIFAYNFLIFSGLFYMWLLSRAPKPVTPSAPSRATRVEWSFGQSDNILGQMTKNLRHRKATNPKDMSFGINTILSNVSTHALPPPINYRLSQLQIYQQLATHLVAETGGMQVLELAAHNSIATGPSWVPDFSSCSEDVTEGSWLQCVLSDGAVIQKTFGHPYCQISGRHPGTMHVKGHILSDSVSEIFPLLETQDTYHEFEAEKHISNITSKQRLRNNNTFSVFHGAWKHPTIDPLDTLYGQHLLSHSPSALLTLWTDKDSQNSRFHFLLHRTSTTRKIYHIFLLLFRFLASLLVLIGPMTSKKKRYLARWVSIVFYRASPADIFALHVESCNKLVRHGLRPFRTGSTFGLCRGDVRVGDRVALISGVRWPVVVRGVGDMGEVRVVGPTFCEDDVMDGRVWGNMTRERRRERGGCREEAEEEGKIEEDAPLMEGVDLGSMDVGQDEEGEGGEGDYEGLDDIYIV